MKTVVSIFLMLHGLTHTILALVPSPKAPDPSIATFFSGMGSWLLTRSGFLKSTGRPIATTLAVVAAVGFVTAGMALLDVLIPFNGWRVLAIASAVVSLLLVVLFWDPYLVVGLLIDVAVLVTLLFTEWPGDLI